MSDLDKDLTTSGPLSGVGSYFESSWELLVGDLAEFDLIYKTNDEEKINGLPVHRAEFSGVDKNFDVPVYYQVAIYQSDKGFHKILAWCNKEHKRLFKESIDHTIGSFQRGE